ncbi:MAG: trypsin-like peptidase domain-containing protein [Candidatus Pacebacteria bacterium]|nr:trypsin-like peptidase domain-containing protein [Candidatus Paceibacterota bacterium]
MEAIKELLINGAVLILGLISSALGMGEAVDREEVAIAPPPMPALENWNPGVHPPTLEEVIYELLRSAEDTIATDSSPSIPPLSFPTPSPVRPPVIVAPPVVIPPTNTEVPLPVTEDPGGHTSTTALLKGALVNIICIPAKGYNVQGTSGTGVVIDSRGIIVTVAHVAQNFLLEDFPTKDAGNCVIRTGSPAKNAYDAELIYLSSTWIEENPETIVTSRPKGTGKDDFAFLAITKSLTGSLPASFTAVKLAPVGARVAEGDKIVSGSYGAEFLTSSEIRSSLYPTIAFGSIKEAYTFSKVTGNPDIFSVNAGAAAQEGSSGGGVLDAKDRFIGAITTRTVRADLSLRDLQAITIDHIRREFKRETGKDLDTYLSGNTQALVSGYEDDAAKLLDVIKEAIH